MPESSLAKRAAEMEFAKIMAGEGKVQSHIMLGMRYLEEYPPNIEKAKQHFRRAGEEGIGDGWLLLFFIEDREAAADDNVPKLLEYLRRAINAGNAHARAELGRLHLDARDRQTREIGWELVNQSIEKGSIEGMYLLALELVRGIPPAWKNITQALQLFEFCRAHGHHASLYQLAVLHFRKIAPDRWFCDQSLRVLLQFLELSFLFDDSVVAWEAAAAGDLLYALRLYERLADMGSENAAWNAERLSSELGLNSSVWFDLQIKMESAGAIERSAEGRTQKAGGRTQTTENSSPGMDGIHALEAAARISPRAAFTLGWQKRRTAWREAEGLFAQAVALSGHAAFPVALARAWCFAEKALPALIDWCAGRETDDSRFVAGVLRAASRGFAAIFLLIALYVVIGVRVGIFCARRNQNQGGAS
jgi:TPR repeat protein